MSCKSYTRVEWLHSSPDEPVELWSELDKDRFELRKVELWADGRAGYAAPSLEVCGTRLGLEPLPPLNEIASDPQFKPEQVSQVAFEEMWASKVR